MTDLYRPHPNPLLAPSPWARRLRRLAYLLLILAGFLVLLWFARNAEAAPMDARWEPPSTPACVIEKQHVKSDCVRTIGVFERRSCGIARAGLKLCKQGH